MRHVHLATIDGLFLSALFTAHALNLMRFWKAVYSGLKNGHD